MKKTLLVASLLAAQVALAATPSEGVALNVRRGFFTETDIGAFMVLGGADTYSNAQTYLQLVLGYDINDRIELGFSLGLGASAADCFAQRDAAGDCTSDGTSMGTPLPDNFTNVFMDVTGAYLFKIYERLYLAPRLAVGYTFLDPAPTLDNSGKGVGGGPNLGVGVTLEYATYLDHFSVGLEFMYRFVIGPNFHALTLFPRVKYTF